ncbi:hypothetical protein CSOJ01_09231 [Colletotrichum sojae]|uniref:Uncharacterized protein n=1 Tax=Colletotrichum sojae TaxID=2175907 RepID=A0A8H6MQX0_9PEZI|nr:hypothetical protein CSOJ01_09231 [Colletotrichum sojae]
MIHRDSRHTRPKPPRTALPRRRDCPIISSLPASSSPGDDETAESDYLPYPANKLIIGQYYYCSRESPCWWGWLIVGTFYDERNNPVWSTQIFALQRDTRGDSDSEAESEESDSSSDLAEQFTNLNLSQNNTFTASSRHWNPALAGPVPGHWISQYDPSLGNWMSNPLNGPDADPRRPPWGPSTGMQVPRYGEAYIPHAGFSSAQPYGNVAYPQGGGGYYSYPYPAAPYPGSGAYTWPHANFAPQTTYPLQPSGHAQSFARTAQSLPQLDPRNPAAQLSNSTGGTGCEPGYNYFFPAAHTKIHVFRTSTPPWQLPANARIQFSAFHVPVNTTLSEILKGFGATNETPKKNKCFEIVQAGNGKWYKGLCFSGDDKDMMKKSISEVGWDATRTGQPGGKPVVCLWLVKD